MLNGIAGYHRSGKEYFGVESKSSALLTSENAEMKREAKGRSDLRMRRWDQGAITRRLSITWAWRRSI